MNLLEALLYGAVQGITEYLPISSSAHLILLPKFLKTEDPGLAFDVFLHLGTLLATLAYFWRDWLRVARTLRNPLNLAATEAGVVPWQWIGLASVPVLVCGALFHHHVETVLRGNAVLMTTLPLGGLLLFASDRWCRSRKDLAALSWKEALTVGLFQCLSLMPGMSRSGSTMTGARLMGLDRAAAARFSFLVSAPVTAAAVVFKLKDYRELLDGPVGAGALITACFSSFVFGIVAIGGLMRLLRRFGYLSFFMYRSALAVVIFLVLGVG